MLAAASLMDERGGSAELRLQEVLETDPHVPCRADLAEALRLEAEPLLERSRASFEDRLRHDRVHAAAQVTDVHGGKLGGGRERSPLDRLRRTGGPLAREGDRRL